MNQIARMMKRYIKMPLKYALPLLFISAIALISITGCVSTTDTTSDSGSNSGGSSDSGIRTVSIADSIDTAYSYAGFISIKPFTQSTNKNGYTVYSGVVDDGPDVLDPYRNTVTIVMTPNRDSALSTYQAAIADAKSKGYTSWVNDQAGLHSWYANTGSLHYPNKQVKIEISEPSSYGISPYGADVNLRIDAHKYAVSTVYQAAPSS